MFSSVAVIDAALGDFDVLRSSISPDSEVVMFNRETDSFRDVIDDILATIDPDEGIDSLSVFSHGRDGAFQMGSDWIDADALSASPDAWATLGDRLSDDAIISLFSCETASTDQGRAFVNELALLTGADVYASDDLTGLGGDLVLEVASDGNATPWSSLTASPVDLSLLSGWEETLAGDISGTVYEDVDGDGDVGDDGVGVSGVTVEVFLDDGDGTIDAGDVSQGTTTTAVDGTYSFAGLADGTYWVVINSKEVAPSAGFNALFGQGDVWAEQTYGSVGAVSYDGSYSYLGSAGAFYGGMRLEQSDDATALTSAEHVTRATVAGANVTGVDSGFSFQVVTRTGDADDDGVNNRSMQGGLRQFIQNSNAIVGTQTSQFVMSTNDSNYNGTGNSEWTFQPNGSELPGISDAVVLDGTTQSTYSGTPVIEIDGSLAGANEDGLSVQDTAGGTVIRGLAINMFEDDGISLDAQTIVEACYIGTDITGTVAARNVGQGIYVGNDADGSIIGGTTAAQRNVISGNDQNGIQIDTGANITIQGNYLGLNAAGTGEIANERDGIEITGAADTILIGGDVAGAGNVITGNDYYGIEVDNGTNVTISGNLIGTNATGTATFENYYGILLKSNASNVMIGGTTAAERNVVSGSENDAIRSEGATNVTIYGNYVGLDITGTNSLGNGDEGIEIRDGGSDVTVGGSGAGMANVIGGNSGDGIKADNTTNLVIEGNLVGLDASGTLDRGNGDEGIEIGTGADGVQILGNTVAGNNGYGMYVESANAVITGNQIGTDLAGTATFDNWAGALYLKNSANGATVGGTLASERNIISGSTSNGITVDGTSSVTIQGNYIGLDANGDAAMGNGGHGITLINAADTITIGGSAAGAGNVIAGNTLDGVNINASTNVTIEGNTIGLDATGAQIRANGDDGISIEAASSSVAIGGSAAGEGNVIAGNGDDGVFVTASSNVTIQGNIIGLDATGATDLGNTGDGIDVEGVSDTITIGGTLAGERNIISGNDESGIEAGDTTNLIIRGNYIGTDVNGTAGLGNSSYGISLLSGANGAIIGGSAAGAGNVIAGNTLSGVIINGVNNVTIQGNTIGLDANGTASLANGGDGINIGGTSDSITIGGTLAGERNIISGNSAAGIEAGDVTNLIIRGNYIGTDINGTADLGNISHGISLLSGADGAIIGGSAAGAGNVIAGNDDDGIKITGVNNVTIQGNIIGLDATGTAALGNAGDGINVGGTSDSITIGGTLAGEENIISGNSAAGIEAGDTTNLIIRGNYIGTDINGTADFGNGADGISIRSGANDAIIGGTVADAGNIIFNNGAAGVEVITSTGVQILGNSIYNNAGLGIDLDGDGVTANDDGDGDVGGNNDQNFPVLEGTLTNEADTLWLYGSLASSAGVNYRIEFFSNTAADSSGYGEGETYLGFIEVTTDGNGEASFETTMAMALTEGMYITATATNLTTMDTGEFSLASLAEIPTINLEAGSAVTHTISKSATRVSSTADVTTNADFWNGGTLVLNLSGAVQTYDSLKIRSGVAGITLSGTDVQYNSVTIGTTTATEITGNDTMTITFNDAATQSAVDGVMRALYFEVLNDNSTNTSQRHVDFSVTNAMSYSAADQITVNLQIFVEPESEEYDEEEPAPAPEPEPEPEPEEEETTAPLQPIVDEQDVEDETVNFDDDSNVVTPGMPSDTENSSDTQDGQEQPEDSEEQNEDSKTQKDDDHQDEHDQDESNRTQKDQEESSHEQDHDAMTIETVSQNGSGNGMAGGPVTIIDQPGSLNVYRNKPIAQAASLETFSEEIQKSMEEETVESRQKVRAVTLVAGTTTMLFSTGYLVWFIQAGLLKSALLTSLPLWRWMDPLPILSGNKPHERAARVKKRKRKDNKLDKIEGMFDSKEA